jgi:uronate dehydrogenase
MDRVLITGAAGGIGRMIRPLLRGIYPVIRLSDIAEIDPEAGEEFMPADLADMAAVERICAGVDGVIHLGASSVEDRWEPILNNNIVGCYNLFEAARRQGMRRVVFATTNHVVGFYRRQRTIDHTVMPRPDSRYGVSKAFGEACTPTSTGCGCSTSGSAMSITARSTVGACRSGSARAIWSS